MLAHISIYHKDLFRTPRRCGCDIGNEVYVEFKILNRHLRERSSIHYKTRQEQL